MLFPPSLHLHDILILNVPSCLSVSPDFTSVYTLFSLFSPNSHSFFFFFLNLDFSPGTAKCVHPVALATGGDHMSEWMNKRPGEPLCKRAVERGENQISFF